MLFSDIESKDEYKAFFDLLLASDDAKNQNHHLIPKWIKDIKKKIKKSAT